MNRDTGFHPSDPDWTRGRAQYVADAEAIARMQMGMTRKVTMKQEEPPREARDDKEGGSERA